MAEQKHIDYRINSAGDSCKETMSYLKTAVYRKTTQFKDSRKYGPPMTDEQLEDMAKRLEWLDEELNRVLAKYIEI